MRINAVITEQASSSKGVADILGKLDTGDLVRARVLEMTSGELLLKLSDGTVLRAAIASEIDTAPGENLELVVKGRNGGTLILETVKKDALSPENSRNETMKLLDSLNIKPDARNMLLAGEVKTAGVHATRELLDNVSLLLDQFKALTPEKAVFLSSKGLSSGHYSLDAAIRLIEGNLKLGGQLEDLHSILSKLADGDVMNEPAQNSRQLQKIPAPDPGSILSTMDETTGNIANKIPLNRQTAVDNGNVNHPANLPGNRMVTGKEDSAGGNSPGGASLLIMQESGEEASPAAKQSNASLTGGAPEANPDEAAFLKTVKQDQEVLLNKPNNLEDRSNEMKELAGKLKEAFKGLFVHTESEKLSSELEVKKIYSDILDKLDGIKHLSQGASPSDRADIMAKATGIEEGIRLLNQISTNNVYVQIPLNLSGFHTTMELYVMKKEKNKKRIDPRNAVVLLSLDTQNLGRVEALMDVKDKNVGINLRAEEQKVIDFMKENYRHLYSSLLEKGYKLVDVRYRLLEERVNPVNAERLAGKELKDGRMSVDLKI